VTSSANPLIIGHRGASSQAPENTFASFNLALAKGADGLEFDVRLSADRKPVVIHDDTLMRTAGRRELVRDLSSEQLHHIDVGSWFDLKHGTTQFGGQTIPSLDDLFRLCSNSHALLYLEMKSEPQDRQALVKACADSIREHGFVDRVIAESFDLTAVADIKKQIPSLRTASLFEPTLQTAPLLIRQRLVARAREVNSEQVALHHKLARKNIVEGILNAGMNVVVWTVDSPDWIQKARTLKIDALITNDPSSLLAQRNSNE
jgi:glycerophosphoryl diester phosphodiesterase